MPYDRPPLSKAVLLGKEPGTALFVRPAEFYADRRIALFLDEAVTRVAPVEKSIETAKGRSLNYDALVFATGAKARRLVMPGADDPRVMLLRNLDDALALRARLVEKPRLAVIGGGLIGLEVAAAARQLGCAVNVLEAGERLMARGFHQRTHGRLASAARRQAPSGGPARSD